MHLDDKITEFDGLWDEIYEYFCRYKKTFSRKTLAEWCGIGRRTSFSFYTYKKFSTCIQSNLRRLSNLFDNSEFNKQHNAEELKKYWSKEFIKCANNVANNAYSLLMKKWVGK